MSVTTQSPSESCTYCDEPYTPPTGAPGYCSEACYTRERGRKCINQIESDHTFCATCFGKLKDVYPAKPVIVEGPEHANRKDDQGPKDVSDGIEIATDRSVWAVDDRSNDPYRRFEYQRKGCVCGAVNPQDTHGIIQALHYHASIANLFNALTQAYQKEAIPHAPDWEAYINAFRDPWRGAEYAVGKAVYTES